MGNGPPDGNNEKSGIDGEELKKKSKQGGPRKRVSQACDKCRSRKDKCDGKKPVRKYPYAKCLYLLRILGIKKWERANSSWERRIYGQSEAPARIEARNRCYGLWEEGTEKRKFFDIEADYHTCIGLLDMYCKRPRMFI